MNQYTFSYIKMGGEVIKYTCLAKTLSEARGKGKEFLEILQKDFIYIVSYSLTEIKEV